MPLQIIVFYLFQEIIYLLRAKEVSQAISFLTLTKRENGEWVYTCKNIIINGLNIKDCWGDCIFVTKNAKNVLIEKCNLDNV